MNKILIGILIVLTPALSRAQLGGIIKKAKEKISNKIDTRISNKTDKAIDKVLDKAEGKDIPPSRKKPTEEQTNKNTTSTSSTVNEQIMPVTNSYAKYDFVAGEKIIYSNDFSDESLGELPVGWNSNGNAAVVNVNGLPGNWVQLYRNSFYLTDNRAFFTENFTIEFDLLLRRSNPKAAFPQLGFGMIATHKDSTTHNQSIKEYTKYFAAELKVQPSDYSGSHLHYESFENFNQYLGTDIKKYPTLEKQFNIPIHIAIQVQKERLRIWFNESKLYDLPKAIKSGIQLNQFFLFMKGNGDQEEDVGYNISNLKIAMGIPDLRHKLLDEGKFSTTGILFDVNTAIIKPESSGVLKEIADVMTQFPDLKIKVIGHTDSDGSDAANLELSQKRAEAVKQKLSATFNIDAGRIQSYGKGESEPDGDNKTRDGKARNRRVEFIKI